MAMKAQRLKYKKQVSYNFARSSVYLQGQKGKKIVKVDPNWAFPHCNLSYNSPMAAKWRTQLEIAHKRSSLNFQGHTGHKSQAI